jgi:hypothetical protein
MSKESPFYAVPSGVDIAHYFIEEWCQRFDAQGADGMPLWRDGKAYSYMWLEAKVDHDLEQYFLLDIRTAQGEQPFDETRDYLFVTVGVGLRIECEWHNHPIGFAADTEAHLERLNAGLKWFVQGVVEGTERVVDRHSP